MPESLLPPQPVPSTLSPEEETMLSDIANAIGGNDCIVFLGAGVHGTPHSDATVSDLLARVPRDVYENAVNVAAAKPRADGKPHDASSLLRGALDEILTRVYPPAARPMLGGDLSQHLAGLGPRRFVDVFQNDSPRNLGRVSLYYELDPARQGRNGLVNEIERAVHTDKSPSPIMRAIATLPFTLFVTTNYDQLLERALRKHDREPFINIYDKKAERRMLDWSKRINAKAPYLLKLHGDVLQSDSIVVTDEDYIQFVLRMTDKPPMNPVPEGIRAQFKDNSILFIGYSLMDYNLRLLFKTIRWSMDLADIKPSYSVDPFPNELVVRVLSIREEQVKFIAQDAWTIVPRLYERIIGKPFDLNAI